MKDASCLYCHSTNILKNGVLTTWGQRYKCKDCPRHFTLGGARGTYDQEFKDSIARAYCHQKHSARVLAHDHQLSTATIVQRGKQHKQSCTECKHKSHA